MCFSGLETLIFTLEFGNNWVLCQINWVSIPKFLKIILYLLKTFGYFTRILPLSLALPTISVFSETQPPSRAKPTGRLFYQLGPGKTSNQKNVYKIQYQKESY